MSELRDYVRTPAMDDAAIEAQWRGVRNKRAAAAARRRSTGAAVGVAGVAAVALVGAWWIGTRTLGPASAVDGEDVVQVAAPLPELVRTAPPSLMGPEAKPDTPMAVELAEVAMADGALMRPAAGARVEACTDSAGATCWRVQRGTVTFEPTKGAAPLAVYAGPVEVRGRDASFVIHRKVAGAVHHVSLRVEVGEVEVLRAAGDSVKLSAGEAVTFETGVAGGEAEPAGSAPPATLSPREHEAVEGDDLGADLWTRAKQARRTGQHAQAAALYAELLADHRDDPKAGLAALELARLRMDTLDDVAGAIAPLRRALRDRRASIREDALARLVRAHEALGEFAQCSERRSQYLARHPEGVHTSTVERACGGG